MTDWQMKRTSAEPILCQCVRRHFFDLKGTKCGVAISFFIFISTLLLTSCSTIDDDLSQCKTSKIEYDLTLVTNITTEIQTPFS